MEQLANAPVSITNVQVESPDEKHLTSQAQGALNIARASIITDATTYAMAANDLQQIKARSTALDEFRKSITKPLDEAKRIIMDKFRGPLELYKQAESILKGALTDYNTEQERLAREEQARIEKQAAWDRMLAEAYAENARIKAEDAAKAAATAETPEAKAAAEEILHAASAKLEVANAESAVVATMPTPVVQPTITKVAGIATKSTWRGECFDKLALIKAVAAGDAPAELLDVAQTPLNQMARALKGAMNYPGCRAVEEKGIAASRR